MIHVEVVYALPQKQRLIGLDVPDGTSMLDAAKLSGICLLYTSPSPRDRG